MRYYKVTDSGYIRGIGTGLGGIEITEAEYIALLNIIRNRPDPSNGYGYRLTESLEWEQCKLPVENMVEGEEA